jgi:hypothetical protein
VRDQGAVDDRDVALRSAAYRRRHEQWAEGVDHPVGGGVRDPEQWADLTHGQVGTPVHGYQQDPVGQGECPRPSRQAIGDAVAAAFGDQAYEAVELGWLQPGERVDQLRTRG